mgnify:CR=1 FL=1
MNYSEHIDQLVAAIAMARQEIPAFPRNQTVEVTTNKGQKYSFSYATLDSILDVVAPLLAKHGLVLFAGADYAQDGSMLVVTRIAHTSGQWAESAINVGRVEDLKEIGSAITYARRYQTQAILGVQADEDLDTDAPRSTKVPKARTPSASLRDTVSTPPPAPQGTTGHPPGTPLKGEPKSAAQEAARPTRSQLRRLFALKTKHGLSDEALKLQLTAYGVVSTKDLGLEQYQAVCDWIEAQGGVPDGMLPGTEEQWAALQTRGTVAGLLPEGWERLREQGNYVAAELHVEFMEGKAPEQAQPALED